MRKYWKPLMILPIKKPYSWSMNFQNVSRLIHRLKILSSPCLVPAPVCWAVTRAGYAAVFRCVHITKFSQLLYAHFVGRKEGLRETTLPAWVPRLVERLLWISTLQAEYKATVFGCFLRFFHFSIFKKQYIQISFLLINIRLHHSA